MPQELSKQTLPPSAADPAQDPEAADSHDEDEDQPEASSAAAGSSSPSAKKKKKKSKKGKEKAEIAGEKVNQKVVDSLLKNNPSLAGEIAGMDQKKVGEMLKHMKLEDLITGMAPGGKNKTDMGSFKFWNTQPVPKFDEKPAPPKPDGPLKPGDPEAVPKEGAALIDGFEWCTMDLEDEVQMKEVYELLCGHYVEDNEAMFRFNYSVSFLNWALKAPGWTAKWHVGVRVTGSKKLVAFISGIPVKLQVREKLVECSEINFLCIHKKLRSKRLTPVLITEITRRCNQDGIWQAIYTAGVLLPKPVATCRYYHRSLDWLKLHEVGFSPLPPNSTKARQITRYQLPSTTSTPGLREAKKEDLDAVLDLNERYLKRYDIFPRYSKEEMEHWFLDHTSDPKDRVIWTYVVEDPETKKITDFFSFYNLESSVIGNTKHRTIRAAYMFYYATETAFQSTDQAKEDRKALKNRLNDLVKDALILAKKHKFDVFNALTLLDNTLFLEQQRFGAGDGQLHYYLFNWRTPQIPGGITAKNELDEKEGSGVGMVML